MHKTALAAALTATLLLACSNRETPKPLPKTGYSPGWLGVASHGAPVFAEVHLPSPPRAIR